MSIAHPRYAVAAVTLLLGGCAHLIAEPMRGDPVFEPAWNTPDEVGAFVPADRVEDAEPSAKRPALAKRPGATKPKSVAKRQAPAGRKAASRSQAPANRKTVAKRADRPKRSTKAPAARSASRPKRTASKRSSAAAAGKAGKAGDLPPMDDLDRGARRVAAAVERIGDEVGRDARLVGDVFAALGEHRELEGHAALPAQLNKRLRKAGRFVPRERVAPGDVVFFRNTADINGSGRPDDGVTMVGIVERVEDDRVVFISQRAGRVRRMALDPGRPGLVRDDRGQVVNTKLVRWPGIREPLTAGQCFAGFARP